MHRKSRGSSLSRARSVISRSISSCVSLMGDSRVSAAGRSWPAPRLAVGLQWPNIRPDAIADSRVNPPERVHTMSGIIKRIGVRTPLQAGFAFPRLCVSLICARSITASRLAHESGDAPGITWPYRIAGALTARRVLCEVRLEAREYLGQGTRQRLSLSITRHRAAGGAPPTTSIRVLPLRRFSGYTARHNVPPC